MSKAPWSSDDVRKAVNFMDRAKVCMDACEGISTEALEYGVVKEMKFALEQIIRELPQKRDWLNPDIERLAKSAIAKAKGE